MDGNKNNTSISPEETKTQREPTMTAPTEVFDAMPSPPAYTPPQTTTVPYAPPADARPVPPPFQNYVPPIPPPAWPDMVRPGAYIHPTVNPYAPQSPGQTYTPYGYTPPQVPPPIVSQPSSGRAVAAMVLGIVSVVLYFLPIVGFVASIIALCLSGSVLSKREPGRGLAIAGLVTSIVGCLLGVIATIVWIAAGKAIINGSYQYW